MKSDSVFEFDQTWDQQQRQLIEQAMLVAEQQGKKSEAAEHAAIMQELRVDHEIIAAGILFASGISKPVGFDDRLSALCQEAMRLNAEEDGWIAQLEQQNDLNTEDTQSHHMMLLSMMKDVRVVFILLAHQLWIMRHIKGADPKHRRAEAWETRVIFAPLANRLGIGQLKWELEDLAFRFLEEDGYKEIAKKLEEKRQDREDYIRNVVSALSTLLEESGVRAQVYGRPKHIYSIWKKMQAKNLEFEDLYDVRAIRVLVDDISQCYTALSAVHSKWPFIPGEYDDYISAPKSNNYQSLHTAVIGPEGRTVEIQIRTHDMHEFAELGVAAHWRYKEGGRRDEGLEKRIESVRQMLEEGRIDESDSEMVSSDEESVFVLTPKGQVLELPSGSTPLDFAYHIHTELGHRCRGAKINGDMVQLTTKLNSGDHVEIITTKIGQPSRDWLSPSSGYLKSSRARAKVRQWFKQQFRDENISAGKAAVHKEAVKRSIGEPDLSSVVPRFNFSSTDDVYAAIGRGELGAAQVVNVVQETVQAPVVEPDEIHTSSARKSVGSGKIDVYGVGDLLTHMARCCKPMPGDEIVGFITRGRGVSIHRQDCANARALGEQNSDRLINVSWGKQDHGNYEVDILIEALDRSGLLRDVTSVLSAEDVNVVAANTFSNRKLQQATLKLTLEINNSQKLDRALNRLQQVRGVFEAVRTK
ncbi:MAG: bifunctional (p)ppGpp synthetase/guanosine-3',5'-bis(diphosphate) 3'-pyrophosphohydrolase [Gammaproteobacteria bacterium]|nr:bifunctional (p)ppGpp synthetase/guanosine-3',5'-bis(diphosphate) 3'-pyrophosphohydrolase [Gammaproteobacteria bacterium]